MPVSLLLLRVGPDGVVVAPPHLDQHPRLGEAVEDLVARQLVTQRAVDALVIAVLPWQAWRDVERLYANLLNLCDKADRQSPMPSRSDVVGFTHECSLVWRRTAQCIVVRIAMPGQMRAASGPALNPGE